MCTIIGGAVYVERRMGQTMPRDELQSAFDRAKTDQTDKFDAILKKMDEQRDSRHELINTVHALALKVAVLSDRYDRAERMDR
jgi:hypothetical protein